ncbi:MAG TPA: thiamine pyrophosphate-dependent enzyme [Chloroflexota bacterium]|jgi:2-oxoglutarate ferredoxin oxidoreductase subunit beta
MAIDTRLTARDYKTDVHNNWCPGCGDFGILTAIQSALAQLKIPPHKVAVFSGIGCSGKAPHYINAYGFHTLHGRALPTATGAKLANLDLTVLAVGGDGDGFGIGAGYFVNTGRRNLDFTYIVFDNGVYGLTKGQGSPTLARGLQTKSMPEPALQDGINPIALAVGAGYTFIARGFALDVKHLTGLIAAAIEHKGTSFIDVLQTCPTYNDLYTKEWYQGARDSQPRLYKLEEQGYDSEVHDPSDPEELVAKKLQAIGKSYEWGPRIPLGVYYKANLPTYEQEAIERRPSLGKTPLAAMKLDGRDTTPLLDALR